MKTMNTVLIVLGGLLGLAAVNFHPMLSLKSPGMQKYSSHGITAFAHPRDAKEVVRITERISRRMERIGELLGAGQSEPVSVIVYPDRKTLHRKTIGLVGMLLPDWYVGKNTQAHVLITSPANPGPSHDRDSILAAAVHEYVHVLTDRRNKELGYWLKEGIALYLADQVPSIDSVRSHADLRWEEYANPSALQFAEVGGYTLAYTLVEYLERHYGWEAVVRLTSPDASTRSVLGMDERELFQQWMEEVRAL